MTYVLAIGAAALIALIALAFLTFLLVSAIIIRRGGNPFKDAL